LRIDEVVDRDELELAMIDDLLEQSATDAPHAVDGDSHSRVLLSRAADVVLEPAGSGLSATQEHPLGHGCKGVAKRACRRQRPYRGSNASRGREHPPRRQTRDAQRERHALGSAAVLAGIGLNREW